MDTTTGARESLNVIEELKNTTFKAAKEIKSNDETFKTSTLPECKDKLRKLIKQHAELSCKNQIIEDTFEALVAFIGEHEELDQDDLTLRYDEQIKETINNVEPTVEIEFASKLEELLADKKEDDDISELETEQSKQIPLDPITRKEIKHAVKNKVCGHIYDRQGIDMLFEQHESMYQNQGKTRNKNYVNRIRCPRIGCSNSSLKISDIIDDDETNQLIQDIRQAQARA